MLSIRAGHAGDVPLLRTLIREFAAYENLQATVTEASLLRDGFGDRPRFRVLIAEWDGQPAGYALFFDYYSTFESHAGFFLEDIYVREQYRGNEHRQSIARPRGGDCAGRKLPCAALASARLEYRRDRVLSKTWS